MAAFRWTCVAALAATVGAVLPVEPVRATEGTTEVLIGFDTAGAMQRALTDTVTPADPSAQTVDATTALAQLTPDEITDLARDPRVSVIEPDSPVFTAEVPDDPCLTGCAGGSAYHVGSLDLPSAWNLTHGQGSVIAVIDSGTDALVVSTNPDLTGKVLADAVPSTVGPPCASGDIIHHGTAVATVAAARPDNGFGTAGTGWDATVLPIRVFHVLNGACTARTSDLIAAIDIAIARGVEVINMSLTTAGNNSLLRDAIGRAINAGIPVVAAAGNSNSSDPGFDKGGYPAFWPEVIAVGATTTNGTKATFSNFGPSVDVYAPGVGLPAFNRAGLLSLFSGTSFSAPVVAGLVALMRSAYVPASPAEIQATLVGTATPIAGVAGGRAAGAYGAVLAMPTADLLLRNSPTAGPAERAYSYGLASYQHLHCDFDGDGVDGIVVFTGGTWVHRASSTPGPGASFAFGTAGYTAVCGNWDGTPGDGIGVFVNGSWYLRNSPSAGPPQISFAFGAPGYSPVVGDWDGNGVDSMGVFVGGTWYLRNSTTPGAAIPVRFGTTGYVPVVGDWNGGGGPDGIGVYVQGMWYLRDLATEGPPQRTIAYGSGAATPITGATATAGLDGIGIVFP